MNADEDYEVYERAMVRFQKAEAQLRAAIREVEMAQAERVQALSRWARVVEENADMLKTEN